LISHARTILNNKPEFYFTTREITRPRNEGAEQHIAVSESEFHLQNDAAQYAIIWHAHSTWYGISRTIDDRLAESKVVVFNGSRAAINEIKKRFTGIKIIYITAPDNIIADRLTSRGRESDPQVKERIARNEQLAVIPEGVIHLSNSGSLQQTLEKFVGILQKISKDEC